MNRGIFIRVCLCVLIVGILLYTYLNQQNSITQLQLQIPQLTRELASIREENTRLQFLIDQFESPSHLMELARLPQFSHLKYPRADEVIVIPLSQEES